MNRRSEGQEHSIKLFLNSWSPVLLVVALTASSSVLVAQDPGDPWPKTVDEFRAAVQKVLDETGIPGAGIALVRQSGVEWAGGVGLADRDRRTPVTGDTHFRAGSISKTFVAMALVQLSEDGDVDLDTPIVEIASEVPFDNPWEAGSPVRVIHLLQHTAGFDDMRFNEIYNLEDPPDLPLLEVLHRNPRSRDVRWRPGTRVAYSNPGFGIAGFLIEKITGEPYEDFIARRTFEPIGMTTSSFRLTREDEALLAKGYRDRTGPPVDYLPIYLRPAGNLHTSAAELGRFVQVLLNWGETDEQLVIDPEYLSNMEHPRTSLASDAGLHTGYGSAFAASTIEGFPMLGHGGGIDGFQSLFAYSTSRDVGFVVLLNSTHTTQAMQRISQLAVRYLKAAAFLEWLATGTTVTATAEGLRLDPVFGSPAELIPVSANLFRSDADADATRVFTTDDAGTMVLTGGFFYAERRPRWQVEIIRWPVLLAFVLAFTPLAMLIPWTVHAPRAAPAGFWWTKSTLLLVSAGVLLIVLGIMNVSDRSLGTQNAWTAAIFLGSILLPAVAIMSLLFTLDAWRRGAGPWLRAYALTVSVAALVLSAYLSSWGLLAFRSWAY